MLAPAMENHVVRLEPLRLDHVEPLLAAATEDRTTYGLAPVPGDRDEMRAYVEVALESAEAGREVPYAIVRRGGQDGSESVVGSMRLMSLVWWPVSPGNALVDRVPRRAEDGDPPDVAEIGHVWLAASAQRTAVFSASCFLLLCHAFEEWRVHRLVLKTDARNQRSRDAITRLGGTFEGILRRHLPAADGGVRDTAMFSILPEEWPPLKARLEESLAQKERRP